MGFLKDIIPHIKERPTMFVLGILFIAFGLIQRFTDLDAITGIGVALFLIYGPWIFFDFIKAKRKVYDFSQHQETMRKAQEVLDRTRTKK